MVVVQPNLWWPHLMSEQPGHMMMVGKVFENIIEFNIEHRKKILKNLLWPHLMVQQPRHMIMVGKIFENIIELNIEEKRY